MGFPQSTHLCSGLRFGLALLLCDVAQLLQQNFAFFVGLAHSKHEFITEPPAELLSQVLVPIAADPEPGRGSPQWSLNHPYNITCLESEVNLVETV
jgi:hypothetical protein